jgi:hypothetical protein
MEPAFLLGEDAEGDIEPIEKAAEVVAEERRPVLPDVAELAGERGRSVPGRRAQKLEEVARGVPAVARAGDLDGDGLADVLVGANWSSAGGEDSGVVYVAHGPVRGTVDLDTVSSRLIGEASGDHTGSAIAGGGDVNGDGYDDVIVGSYSAAAHHRAGVAYLVYGPITTDVDLGQADAVLVGEDSGDGAGYAVSIDEDVNGDGISDPLVGAPLNANHGAAYLVLGPVSGTVYLSQADLKLAASGPDDAGYAVSGAGDVDGDGRDDVLIGAPQAGADATSPWAGAVYLITAESIEGC